MLNIRFRTVGAASLLIALPASAGTFTLIGDQSGPRLNTLLLGITDDGQTAVGITPGQGAEGSTWRWTPTILLEGLGANGGYACISNDGSSIVSEALDFNYPNPPAYSATTAPSRLINGSWESIGGVGPCDITLGWPRDISADGGRIVGGQWQGTCSTYGYLWTAAGGRVALRSHFGLGGSSVANRVSADGSTIVGFNNGPGPGGRVGIYWTFNTTSNIWVANFMNNNFNHGEAYDVSANGDVILARGHNPDNRPFMYRRSTNQFELLGDASAAGFVPLNMTADTNLVTGGPTGQTFVWRRSSNAWVTLGAYMNEFGVADMLTIEQTNLVVATCISPDGRFIGGWYGPTPQIVQGWIFDRDGTAACVADLDDGTGAGTPDGGVTIADLVFFLVQFEAGDLRADVDNGTQSGVRDQAVTVDDLIYFLIRFEAGC